MQEDGGGLGHGHHIPVDLIRPKLRDALFPQLVRFTHADPDVGVEDVAVLRALRYIVGDLQHSARLLGHSAAFFHQLLRRCQLLRAAGTEVHAQLGTYDHQRVCHVVARVAEERQLASAHIAELLARGHDVGQHLRGVEIVGQAVPHRHARVTGEIFDHGLLEAPVLDAVKHAAQHLCGVGQRFLLSHLRRAGVEERHAHAEVARAHLKRAACTRRGLFKQQYDLLARQILVLHAVLLEALELRGQIQHIVDFLRGKIEQGEKASSSDVDAHDKSS